MNLLSSARKGLLAATLATLAIAAHAQAPTPDVAKLVRNPIVQEPVLVYDMTGSTLVGPVHCALQVHNNGLASLAASDFRDSNGSVRVADVGPEVVRALYLDMLRVGASNLRDNLKSVADLPLTTVAFYQAPGPRSLSNAFYTDPSSGPQAKVEAVVRGFLGEHFPDRC